MEYAQRVFKSRVACAGIDEQDVAQLGDIAKALEFFRIYDGDHVLGYVDVPPYGIADGFSCIQKAQVYIHRDR